MPAVKLARRGEPGGREARDHERHFGMIALEQLDQRLQHRDLARRRAVQPDARLKRRTES